MIRLDELHSSRPLPNTAAASRKFLNILASIATVGLVEPLAVARVQGELTPFRVLDGRLRIEALRRLGIEEALCLISTDDESYTYNKHINRLTPAQDARMISRAIERGVLRERIAAVLGIDEVTVKRRASLLEGICPEVAGLLADRNCPGTTFATLKQMKPLRQLEAAELMCGQGNFSSAFAKAILAATPDTLLEQSAPVLRQSDSDLSLQLVRLEKELATLQETSRQGDERYGIEHLHLTVAVTYVASVMGNKVVSSWLAEHYPEIAIQFQSMTGEVTPSEPRRAKKLHFKKRPPPSEASA